jgi:hypothetical protein
MNSRAQNMKTRHVALGSAENEYGRAKQKNGTRGPLYRRKRVQAQNMKTGHDALVTAENEFESAKHENET